MSTCSAASRECVIHKSSFPYAHRSTGFYLIFFFHFAMCTVIFLQSTEWRTGFPDTHKHMRVVAAAIIATVNLRSNTAPWQWQSECRTPANHHPFTIYGADMCSSNSCNCHCFCSTLIDSIPHILG